MGAISTLIPAETLTSVTVPQVPVEVLIGERPSDRFVLAPLDTGPSWKMGGTDRGIRIAVQGSP